MRLTDEIVRALQGAIEDGYESVSDFARQANVSGNTITKCLRKETRSITDESWRKIHPLIRAFLPNGRKADDSHHRPEDLDTAQKVMLDTFSELPKDLQKKRLQELLEIARKHGQSPDDNGPHQKVLLRIFDLIPPEEKKAIVLDSVKLAREQLRLRQERETVAKR